MRMRNVFLAFVTSAIVFFTGLNAASAKDYPYCIQGDDFAGGSGDCIFTTHAQCQAAASGRTSPRAVDWAGLNQVFTCARSISRRQALAACG